MGEPYEVQQLLWDLRHDPSLAAKVQADPDRTMRSYGLSDDEVAALRDRDFPALIGLGVSPLLLYFGALELGVSREAYYAAFDRGPAQPPSTVGS